MELRARSKTPKSICRLTSARERKVVRNQLDGACFSDQNGVNAMEITVPIDSALLDHQCKQWSVSTRHNNRRNSVEMSKRIST